jgi:hypothetical protein
VCPRARSAAAMPLGPPRSDGERSSATRFRTGIPDPDDSEARAGGAAAQTSRPPSRMSVWPVTKDAAGLAR